MIAHSRPIARFIEARAWLGKDRLPARSPKLPFPMTSGVAGILAFREEEMLERAESGCGVELLPDA